MAFGIDHLVLPVHDLDRAAATYEALGFRLTPRARHPFGTANRLVQLQGAFVELLEVDRPELIGPTQVPPSFAEFNRDFLTRGEGLSMLVLEGGEAEATRGALQAAGLAPRPVFSFERDAVQPGGTVERVGFDLVFVDFPNAPKAGFFTCTQTRPDLFWKSEYQAHPNGAKSIHVVTMASPQPAPLADFLSRFSQSRSARRGSGFVIDTPRGRLEAIEDGAEPHFARYVITTGNLNAVRAHARAAGIAYAEKPLGLEFAADVMYGVTVGFRAA
ncbi:Lactoylglutathione lyase and related lyases [hydrothermal vent metagenome]|uniref:Lactoylglutathione lyase and related lyases n=1 Tax=hydrothermal vent metagenome TaxID=652676 RepID=A0A3B0T7M8_9ZZZZ